MKRVMIYCEGPTEETFINRILAPEFWWREVFITASSCNGVSKYSIIKRDLNALCKGDPEMIVTTMLDYYALPSGTPGIGERHGSIYEKVIHVETKIREDIGMGNLLPNLLLHEFEALLFSQPECFSYCGLSLRELQKLCDIRTNADTPENINNNPNTAPSKRILNIYPSYSKPLDGYNIAKDIGLYKIRQECKHFNEWVEKLEALV